MNNGAMNSGDLPQILMAAAVALLLAFTTPRQAIVSSAAFVIAYLLMQLVPLPPSWNEAEAVGLWISVVATAALAYVPPSRWARLVLPLSVNAGLWAGASAAYGGQAIGLAVGLLPLLALVPLRWLVARKFSIVVKVLASWLIAIASLSAFVSLLSTPGYKPDHMQ